MKQNTKKLIAISLLTIGVMLVLTFFNSQHSLENFGATKLTTGFDPVWSNDGSKIFFTQDDYPRVNNILFVMDLDGSNRKRVGEGSLLALSPDGTKIFYIQNLEGLHQAWVMESDGGIREKIGEPTFISLDLPSLYSWSSDRKKISYFTPGNGFQYRIWDIEKNETRPLTTFGHDDIGGLPITDARPSGGSWSPDNKKIVLSQPVLSDGGIIFHIWTIDSESGNKEMLTQFIGDNSFPVWSPDGNNIMYLRETERGKRMHDIWVMDSDGNNKTQLTDSPKHEDGGEWSQDGGKITYVSYDAGCLGWGKKIYEYMETNKSEIWVMNADGTDKKQLLSIPCNKGLIIYNLEWSPDGSKIAFVWWPEPFGFTPIEIYVIDVPIMDKEEKN